MSTHSIWFLGEVRKLSIYLIVKSTLSSAMPLAADLLEDLLFLNIIICVETCDCTCIFREKI